MNNPKSPFLEPRTLVIIGIICVVAVGVFLVVGKDILHRVVEKSKSSESF